MDDLFPVTWQLALKFEQTLRKRIMYTSLAAACTRHVK